MIFEAVVGTAKDGLIYKENLAHGQNTREYNKNNQQKTREKTREKILVAIKENREITIEQLSKKLSISKKGIEWQLKQLKKNGIITRVGPDKCGHWEIVK